MFSNNTGLFIAICILISLLLVCHTMNFIYPRISNSNRNSFINITKPKPIPTQYNVISYDNNMGKIPCDSQAQIPCNVQQQCKKPTQYQYSDSEMAILYKEAYEQAGAELLYRTLNEINNTTTTTPPTTTTPSTTTIPSTTNIF